MKVLVIGAHPDDCEIRCGGTASVLVRNGHQVKFVSATNGEKGHHQQSGSELIQRRRQEAAAAAAVLGVQSHVMEIPDGEIQPDLSTRHAFIRLIRDYAPDILITHRPWDYHPDHRITSQLVQDCSYLVRVPNVCPDAPVPAQAPIILYMWDSFSQPTPFQPTAAVHIDPVYSTKLQALHCHASQVYEWLPWIDGDNTVPAGERDRLTWLEKWMGSRDEAITLKSRQAILQQYGQVKGESIRRAEVFQLSEYGRQISREDLWRLLTAPQ